MDSKPTCSCHRCRRNLPSESALKTQVLSPSTADQSQFALHARAKHVFSEAARVWAFKAASDNAVSLPASKLAACMQCCTRTLTSVLQTLGSLMSASHDSCSKAYECSCPDLDELTQICLYAVLAAGC